MQVSKLLVTHMRRVTFKYTAPHLAKKLPPQRASLTAKQGDELDPCSQPEFWKDVRISQLKAASADCKDRRDGQVVPRGGLLFVCNLIFLGLDWECLEFIPRGPSFYMFLAMAFEFVFNCLSNVI